MTNHLNLFLRDEKRRYLVERNNATGIMRLGLFFAILFSLIFILIGIIGVKDGVSDVVDGVALKTSGVATQALVTRTYTSQGEITSYHITYDYNAPGELQTHRRTTTLSSSAWSATCQGCEIAIIYSARRHEVSRLPDEWPIFRGLMSALSTSLFALIAMVMLWYTLQDQIWYIRQRAQVRMGTILDVSAREDEGVLSITLQLQLDGADNRLSYTWSDNALRGELPQIGQRIAAIYQSDEDFRLV